MKPLFTLAFLLFLAFAGFAQQNVYYLKKNGRYVDIPDSADYTRTINPIDGNPNLYIVTDVYKNGKTKMEAFSTKNSPAVSLEGKCTEYFQSGIIQSRSIYTGNIKGGETSEYYPNGKLYRTIIYPTDGARDNEIMARFTVVANYDSLGKALVQNGKGFYKGYDWDFKYLNEWGKITDGKRDSTWHGEDKKYGFTFTEEYKDGKLIKGTSVKDGETFTYDGVNLRAPAFEGGVPAFSQFLSRNLKYPNEARKNDIYGYVILTFIVEKNGDVSDIRVARSAHPLLDQEAMRILKKSPKWLPGLRHGIPVRVQYSVPINFALQ
ncbi:TonB family protein [Mucilaginibacter conchicola]|uniref:TonB family protein n=1 Tax=Mucilaginibacter conchicola TaxID=2303333 RepID=A0A372NU46_9SPHI|nr:energy transducer TonB [Mucilaginibacter conchicola]RFZ92788.1 TonB family protein [Mucilaginibacter conchicola]